MLLDIYKSSFPINLHELEYSPKIKNTRFLKDGNKIQEIRKIQKREIIWYTKNN